MALDFRSYLLQVTSVGATDLYRAVPPALMLVTSFSLAHALAPRVQRGEKAHLLTSLQVAEPKDRK